MFGLSAKTYENLILKCHPNLFDDNDWYLKQNLKKLVKIMFWLRPICN